MGVFFFVIEMISAFLVMFGTEISGILAFLDEKIEAAAAAAGETTILGISVFG